MARKVFVKVLAEFDRQGEITPKMIYWEDGRRFEVDRILDVRRAASLKVGGSGIRYTCRIQGHPVYLFMDGQSWYMEGKEGT